MTVTTENYVQESYVPQDYVAKPYALSFSADLGTPVGLFEKLARTENYAFLFESTEGDARLARFSFLSADPVLTVSFKDGTAIVGNAQGKQTKAVTNPVLFLETILKQFRARLGALLNSHEQLAEGNFEASVNLPKALAQTPFVGGLVGYMGYGASQYLEKIPQQQIDPTMVPDGYYALYDSVVVFDHQFRRVTLLSLRGEEHANQILAKMLAPGHLQPLKLDLEPLTSEEMFADVSTSVAKEEFIAQVESAKEFIRAGQAFQIVVAQRFSLPTQAPPIDIYRMLQATNPSPYAYYLKYPEFVYLGSSPETFVQCHAGRLMLRAIAGTRKRGNTAEQDKLLGKELQTDEKEMAAHRMLVDLGRNDLGRVSTAGTVKVGELACLSRYTHVMHLETEITGQLADDQTIFSSFQSCFPAGTVSGAPKVRAMQLLSQLEPERRGIYSGAVGYFDLRGNMDGAIAIRSALIKDGIAHMNAGAGIVYDSKSDLEYAETKNKAKSVLQAIKLAQRAL
jgi:anthranilate synthase component I